ncbi:MAG: hypothetical protein WAO25_02920, partial [Bacillota bacterium]
MSTAHAIRLTRQAKRALDRYDERRRRIVTDKLLLLYKNPGHPSLKVHLHTRCSKLEAYISRSDRVIFDMDDGYLNIWDIGPHSVVDRADKDDYSIGEFVHLSIPSTELIDVENGVQELPADIPESEEPYTGHRPRQPSQQLFGDLSNTSLRILGVPGGLVRA